MKRITFQWAEASSVTTKSWRANLFSIVKFWKRPSWNKDILASEILSGGPRRKALFQKKVFFVAFSFHQILYLGIYIMEIRELQWECLNPKQGCHIFLGITYHNGKNIPDNHNVYQIIIIRTHQITLNISQMPTKYTKWP
jgi:hypothetical protein